VISVVRWFLVLIVIAVALAAFPVAAQDEADENGRVYGEIVNGSEGGGDVAGLEVHLTRYQQMDPVETFSTTADENGRFEFSELPVFEGEAYLVRVVYEDIEFTGSMVLLFQDPDNPEVERNITVFERTNDRSVLRILSRGVVIAGADRDAGRIEVLEIIALENESDRVFTGDENGEVLRIALPSNASEIAPQPGFDFGQMFFDEQRSNVLVSTGAVTPGSHNPMISYQIPYDGTSGTLSIGTAMPTSTLRVLVREDTFNISSSVLEPAGIQQVGSDSYEVLAIDSPVVGDTMSVRISGLPRENWNIPVEMSTLLASLAAGVGLVVGAVLIYQVVQRRQVSAAGPAEVEHDARSRYEPESDDLERTRLELAAELNRLEADFERGDLDEDSYHRERDDILERLREISLKVRGIDG
jgi:hypothetical protein